MARTKGYLDRSRTKGYLKKTATICFQMRICLRNLLFQSGFRDPILITETGVSMAFHGRANPDFEQIRIEKCHGNRTYIKAFNDPNMNYEVQGSELKTV